MKKEEAVHIKSKSLAAVEQLTEALLFAEKHLAKDEYLRLKRGVGLSIGTIEMQVNEIIYKQFPELTE